MTFNQAKEIGMACELGTPAEWINNILIHSMNLFAYSDIEEEQTELIIDAAKNGVKFSKVCGDAILDGDSREELCYVCKGLNNV